MPSFRIDHNFDQATVSGAAITDPYFQASVCGTTAGAPTIGARGIIFTTNAGAGKVQGFKLLSTANSLLARSDFFTTDNQPSIGIEFTTKATSLTGVSYFIGWITESPDAVASGTAGRWTAAEIVDGFGFDYCNADETALYAFVKTSTGLSIYHRLDDPLIVLSAGTDYYLWCGLDADRKPQFMVNGKVVWQCPEAMDTLVSLQPFAHGIGNATTMTVQRVVLAKEY